MGGEERMKKGLEEGLHGLDALGGRLPTEDSIQTHHGAKEGHCTAKKRDVVRDGPTFNSARNFLFRGPEKRRLRKGEGEPKGGREIIEPLKEKGRLFYGPYDSNIINISRDSEIAETVYGFLKNRLQTEAEQ